MCIMIRTAAVATSSVAAAAKIATRTKKKGRGFYEFIVDIEISTNLMHLLLLLLHTLLIVLHLLSLLLIDKTNYRTNK